jgi:uncharacterized membrane protein YsdA (DUF1294 family)
MKNMRRNRELNGYIDNVPEWARSVDGIETPNRSEVGRAWAFWLVGTAVTLFMLPVTALVATLCIIAAPWWAMAYLITMNVTTLYVFYLGRRRPVVTETKIGKLKLHAMTLLGGAVGTEIGRRLFSDTVNRRPFGFTVFVGCVLVIWSVNAQHDYVAQ